MDKTVNLDDLDLKIITMLLRDAKIPYLEIANKLKVSLGTVHLRIKKMEAAKLIKSFTLDADFYRLGYTITAFIGLIINSKMHESVVEQMLAIDEVVELHHTTGKYHMFAKIVCEDPRALREVLINKINSIDGIDKTETTISLTEVISRPVCIKSAQLKAFKRKGKK
ncbi:MAG: Lrp/AsnC ligand binding domain-containing protein [Bacteroidetes bacterium]|nr:Lrp/AsnC ligand binding domain-containing protein [Bacteroidota bacterium]